jgi:hypothetical protein
MYVRKGSVVVVKYLFISNNPGTSRSRLTTHFRYAAITIHGIKKGGHKAAFITADAAAIQVRSVWHCNFVLSRWTTHPARMIHLYRT